MLNEVVYHGTDKPSSPWKYEEFKLITGIKKPLEDMVKMGYLLFVISNQPDISRGFIEMGTTEKINDIIMENFPISEISVCPHDDHHNCNCRKPKPGMILDLCKKWGINPEKSFLIGDSWKDVEAGKTAGCKNILLDASYNKTVDVDFRIENLEKAVKIIRDNQKV